MTSLPFVLALAANCRLSPPYTFRARSTFHPAAARTAVTSATLGMFTPSRRSITREAFFLLILFLLKKMKYLGFAVVWPFEVYQRISSGCKHCKKTSL